MGKLITSIFRIKPKKPKVNYRFDENQTTKFVGKPLPAIYGKEHVFGNVVFRRLSDDRKTTDQLVTLCWGPVDIDTKSIRVNERRPHYINGVLNPDRDLEPGFIKDVKVWTYRGTLGQAPIPGYGLLYGLNRTAYIRVVARANDQMSGVNKVECDVRRPTLFTTIAGQGGDYNTPIPAEIAAAFPNGISSANAAAAALDYILNKDYGAGRDPAWFGDFATWIDGINHCNQAVRVDRTGKTQWRKIVGLDVLDNGALLRKRTDLFTWDTLALSRTQVESGDGHVTFGAEPFAVTTGQEPVKVCYQTEVGNKTRHTVTRCYETLQTRTFVENVLVGVVNEEPSPYTNMRFAFHLRGDGQYEVWESGASIGVFGSYTDADEFTIAYESGVVRFKKNGATVRTSSLPPVYPMLAAVSILQKNASTSVADWSGSEYEARYRIWGAVGTEADEEHIDIVEKILQNANASIFESNGVLKLFIAKAKAPVAVLDRSNFEPQAVETADLMEVPNVIEIVYKETDEDGERRSVVWEDKARIDQLREIREELDMPTIPNRTQAARLASYRGRQAIAEGTSLRGVADQKFFNLEPGDVVEVTIGTADSTWFENKKFWIDAISPENKDGDVEIDLVEYGGDSLFDDSTATTIDGNDPVYHKDVSVRLPSPYTTPERPTVFSHTIGRIDKAATPLYYVDLNWEEPAQPGYMHDTFNIYRREHLEDPWVLVATVSGKSMGYRDFVGDIVLHTYLYAVTSVTTAKEESDLPEMYDHFVDSISIDVPAPVENVTATLQTDRSIIIDWDYDRAPVDFAGFEVFYNEGIAYDPDTAVSLSKGLITNARLTTIDIYNAGTYTITVVAADQFGNTSDPTSTTIELADVVKLDALNAVQGVDGVTLTWTTEGDDTGVLYDIRDGQSFDEGTVVAQNHRSTSIFVPLTDAEPHTLHVRAKDRYGHYVATAVSITTSVVEPDDITRFIATAQGDWVSFEWDAVPGLGNKYEIRWGPSWEAGNVVAVVEGDKYETLWAEEGETTFWIKALSRAGLYSFFPYFSTTAVAEIPDRNVLHEEDCKAAGWPGRKQNLEIVSTVDGNVLQVTKSALGFNKGYAAYHHAITLPDRFNCRNWLVSLVGMDLNNSPPWQGNTTIWDEANFTWSTTTEIGGASKRIKIATDVLPSALPGALIEGWTFDGTTTGLRGTTPTASAGIDYGQGRYRQGLHVTDTTTLSYAIVGGPTTFTVAFDVASADDVSKDSVYLRLVGTAGTLTIGWDGTIGRYYVTDGTTTTLVFPSASPPSATEVLKIFFSQSATQRSMFVCSMEQPGSWAAGYEDKGGIGAITAIHLHKDPSDAARSSALAVIGDLEFWTLLPDFELFPRLVETLPQPLGYTPFRDFAAGDYHYQKAILSIEVLAEDPAADYRIEMAKVKVDVPDIHDRGTAELAATGWTPVSFNRTYHVPPEVFPSVKSAAEPAIIEWRNVTKTGFEARAVSRASGAQIAAVTSWGSLGY